MTRRIIAFMIETIRLLLRSVFYYDISGNGLFILLLFYAIATVFQLYPGSDMQ